MADFKDVDYTYTKIDKVVRMILGECLDFNAGMFMGDTSISIEQAQKQKHDFWAKYLGVTKDSRILDMGCGWGPVLNYLRDRGANGVGVALADGQVAACKANGLDAHLQDCRKITPDMFGRFDGVTSLGAFEHFCSIQDHLDGKQEEVYNDLFRVAADLLPVGGRFYLETCVWGENMTYTYDDVDINAKKGSDEWLLGLVEKNYPDSWIPFGAKQIIRSAKPFFKVVHENSGKQDYIDSFVKWRKKSRKFSPKLYANYLALLPRYLTNREFRYRVQGHMVVNPLDVCFKRGIMDYARIIFEKV